jgi:hypothetical protein
MGGKFMENEETGVMILDKGIEEFAETLLACCTSGKLRAKTA